MRAKVLLVAAAVGLSLGVASMPAVAEVGQSVTVDKVLVNKLGGVSVVGSADCSALVSVVREGQFRYVDENDQWQTLTVEPGDQINLYANSDDYTVSQPAGRKGMIRVTHESSRMSPCFMEYVPAGYTSPCEEDGAPCQWKTDHYAYDPALGPLFDYSPDGKFKAGSLSVSVESIGLGVQVFHDGQSIGLYFGPEGSYAYTSTTIRATAYR